MRLTELEVRHFRNIRLARLEPAPGVNVLWGSNAQGKTNMLEAVYYLVTGRSFRTRLDRECLPWEQTWRRWEAELEAAGAPAPPTFVEQTAVARGRLARASGTHELLVTIRGGQKRVTGDGTPIARLGMLWGRLNAVLFTPSDLSVVQGGPSQRRAFLDTTLSQISAPYLSHLQRYSRALKQRNALLRARQPIASLAGHFDAWERQLVDSGLEVARGRFEHIGRLSEAVGRHYGRIAGKNGAGRRDEKDERDAKDGRGEGDERLTLRYNGLFRSGEELEAGAAAERFAGKLAASREDDRARAASTSVGPHRDDFSFSLGGHDLRHYGSQGQQRSAILALRLAEVEVMTERADEAPVLLLDDIIAELDPARTAAFLRAVADLPAQTLITTTRADDVASHVAIDRRWRVEDGGFVAEEEE